MATCSHRGWDESLTTHIGSESEVNPNFPSIATDPRQRPADLESEVSREQTLLQKPEPQINISAPIIQLPAEILSEIFAACLLSNIWNDQLHYISPLIFGEVCRWWREIAWSAPTLWTSMQLNLNPVTDFHVPLANEWLSRSMGQPLAIFVTWEDDKPVSESACTAMMGVIAKYSHQWQEIELRLPDFCYDTLECVRNHLPILRFISIHQDMEEFGPEMRTFDVAPQLRVVEVDGMYLNWVVLPMEQLTSLSVDCGDVDESLAMLQRSPHVIHCAFKNISGSSEDPGPVHVHASQLEVLELIDVNELMNDAANVVLDHLTAPALRRILWHAHRMEDDVPNKTSLDHQAFISLIRRSSCSLESFLLDGLNLYSDNTLIECLQAVPSLTELSLTEVEITNKIFQILDPLYSSNTPSNTLLPNLKILEYSGDLRLDFPVIASLLHSRWEVGEDLLPNNCAARLQSVSIESYAEGIPDDHILDLLKRLINEGMNISLATLDGKWA